MRIMSLLLAVLAIMASMPGQAQEPATNKEYRVDSDTSWLRVLAYPDGPLKRFGHHHVISHHGISGTVEVAPDPLDSTFMLEITRVRSRKRISTAPEPTCLEKSCCTANNFQ